MPLLHQPPACRRWLTLTCAGLLAAGLSAPAAASGPPTLISKTPIGNGYCYHTPPTLGPNGQLFVTAAICGNTLSAVAGVSGLAQDGTLTFGPIAPSDCTNNSYPPRMGMSGISITEAGMVMAATDWNSCRQGRLVAVDPVAGSIAWQTGQCPGAPHPRITPPVDDDSGTALYGSASYCRVDGNGTRTQTVSSVGRYIGGYGALMHGDTLFVGTIDASRSEISATSLATGAVLWRNSYAYTTNDHQAAVALTAAGDVFVQRLAPTSTLTLMDGATGQAVWTASDLQWPAVTDDAVFAGSQTTDDIVALDLSGNELWRTSLGTAAGSATVDFVASDGTLFARSGATVARLAADGQLLWSFVADDQVQAAVRLTAAGQPIFADTLGQAYIIDDCANFLDAPWAVSRGGNERHTGAAGAVSSSVAACQTNEPPVADAGDDADVRVGDTVTLSGSGSVDDSTPTSALVFSWSLQGPAGSTAALSSATAAAPTFVPDVPGQYVATLLVQDADGLQSLPDSVSISTDNLAPTADAGDDITALLGATVALDGSGSNDPEDDPLTFAWTLVSSPTGSTATLSDPAVTMPSFVPDVAGEYTFRLDVLDPIGPGAPDSVTLESLSGDDFAAVQLDLAASLIAALGPDEVSARHQRRLARIVRRAARALRRDRDDRAIRRIDRALRRVDGCLNTGAPDLQRPGRDWVLDCSVQTPIAVALTAAKSAI